MFNFFSSNAKVDELNAELVRRAATINHLQTELGAIRSDYDRLLETVSNSWLVSLLLVARRLITTCVHSVIRNSKNTSNRLIYLDCLCLNC